MTSTLSAEEIASMSDGSHGDPFSVLGFHKIDQKKSERLVLRVYRPEAAQVFVNIGKSKPAELKRLSEEGLFELVFPKRKNPADYTLTIVPHHGESFDIKDPYAYGTMIEDFDLQLWGEGNHKKAYDLWERILKKSEMLKEHILWCQHRAQREFR